MKHKTFLRLILHTLTLKNNEHLKLKIIHTSEDYFRSPLNSLIFEQTLDLFHGRFKPLTASTESRRSIKQ